MNRIKLRSSKPLLPPTITAGNCSTVLRSHLMKVGLKKHIHKQKAKEAKENRKTKETKEEKAKENVVVVNIICRKSNDTRRYGLRICSG